MKTSSNLLLALFLLFAISFSKAQPTIYALPTIPCSSFVVTYQFGLLAPVPGATFYNWSIINGTSTQTFAVNGPTVGPITTTLAPGIYTITMYPFSGTPSFSVPLTTQITSTIINVVAAFNIPIVSNPAGNICTGNNVTLTASGANNYAWPNSSTATSIVVSPTASATYSVIGLSNGGCMGTDIIALNVTNAAPVITLNQASTYTACAGNANLSASGANSYTWSWANGSATTAVISPSVAGCYTVTGSIGAACPTATAASCLTALFPIPTAAILPSNPFPCSGVPIVFTAAGASSYTWTSSLNSLQYYSNPVTITPALPGLVCVSVTAMSSAGCYNSAAICLTVNSGPSINVALTNTSVCQGSSVSFTSTGAATYTWVGGPMTSTYSLIPTATAIYTVAGLGTNGCLGYAYAAVAVDTTCSDVWPGDANSDGLVSTADVLELGLAANSTGASRSPGGNTYVAQYASNWTGLVSTGKNKCHADCNGDGTVNTADTLAIFNNMSLSHAFRPAAPAANADLAIVSAENYAVVNKWNRVDLNFGNTTAPSTSLLGLGFELTFENSLIVPDSIYLVFNASSLNASGANYQFRKLDFAAGRLFVASVRSNQQNANVSGNLASLFFKVSNSATEADHIVIKAENVNYLTQAGQSAILQGGEIDLPVNRSVGLKEQHLQTAFSVYPNPAKDLIRIVAENKAAKDFKIIDVTGRVLMSGELLGEQQVDVAALSAGIYFVEVQSAAGSSIKKIVIED